MTVNDDSDYVYFVIAAPLKAKKCVAGEVRRAESTSVSIYELFHVLCLQM